MRLAERGEADLALAEANTPKIGAFGLSRANTRAVTLWAAFPTAGVFIAHRQAPFRSISPLHSYPVAWGHPKSGTRQLAKDMIAALGLDITKDFSEEPVTSPTIGLERVAAFKASAYWTSWPAIARLPQLQETDARLKQVYVAFTPTRAEVGRILKRNPEMQRFQIPANALPGQSRAIDTVGVWSVLLARPDLPEKTAEALISAIVAAAADTSDPLLRYSTAEATRDLKAPSALHPAAEAAIR